MDSPSRNFITFKIPSNPIDDSVFSKHTCFNRPCLHCRIIKGNNRFVTENTISIL